jgi:hypothetical protein
MDFLVKTTPIPAANPDPSFPGNRISTEPLPSGHPGRPPALDLGIVAALVAWGVWLRLHALSAKTFWFDEGVSVGIARLDWYNFLRILWRREGNMSLYYLLLRPWLHLGDSESFVRSLSVLFGVATIPMMYLLGRKLFSSRVGLIAAALLTVNAYHVRYSQEARSYSLMVLLCVCSSFFFLGCLESPTRARRVSHLACSSAAVYAHFYSVLLLVAQWIAGSHSDRTPAREAKFSWRWIALLISPIALFVATTGAGPLRWIHRPGWRDFAELGLRLTGNGGWILLLAYAMASTAGVIADQTGETGVQPRLRPGRAPFLLLWMLFPVALIYLLSFARPLFLPRYFIVCLPPLLLLAAAGLSSIRSSWLQIPALLAVLLLSWQGTRAYYHEDFDLQREDWRSASEFLLTHSRRDDALMFHVAMGRMPYEYYHSLRGVSASDPAVLYPNHGDRISFLDFVEKPDYRELASEVAAHPRIWLVLSHASDSSGLDRTALSLRNTLEDDAYQEASTRDFGGLEIDLYVRRP